MRRSSWALVIWSGVIVLWMLLIATVDCRTYTGSCSQAKAGNITFLGLIWLLGVLAALGIRFRSQVLRYRARLGSANNAVATAQVAWQQPGLLESRAGHFSAMHNTRWLLPGNTGPHVLAIRRGLFGRLGINVDGRAVANLGRIGFRGVSRTSQPVHVDGHEAVVYGQMVLRQGGLAGAFNLASYYFDVFIDGRSLLDGSEIGVLTGRAEAAVYSPAGQFYRRLWSPANIAPTVTVGEAIAVTREHGFLVGWVILLVGNVLVLQAAARGLRWAARIPPGTRRWLRGLIVAMTVIGLVVVMLAGVAVAQRL